MGRLTFDGVLEAGPGGGALVVLPADVVTGLGGRRLRVRGTFAGVRFQSSTMPSRDGGACLGVHQPTHKSAGVAFGEQARITIERDDSPRVVTVPPELAAALEGDPQARTRFEALSPTHRREYAAWVAEAKREETKARRVADTLTKLRGH